MSDRVVCNGCAVCAEVCPTGCIKLGYVNDCLNTIFLQGYCCCCRACIDWCPTEGLTFFINDLCESLGDLGGHFGTGGGGSEGGGNSGTITDPEKTLGLQCFDKMITDLEYGRVTLKKVNYQEGYPILNAANVGMNANGIITNCLNFIKQTNLDNYAKNFGKFMSIASIPLNVTSTVIAFTDGEITTADILGAVSTALSLVSLVGVFFPPAIVISGIAGVASCVIGLVAVAMDSPNYSIPYETEVNGIKTIYIYHD